MTLAEAIILAFLVFGVVAAAVLAFRVNRKLRREGESLRAIGSRCGNCGEGMAAGVSVCPMCGDEQDERR